MTAFNIKSRDIATARKSTRKLTTRKVEEAAAEYKRRIKLWHSLICRTPEERGVVSIQTSSGFFCFMMDQMQVLVGSNG